MENKQNQSTHKIFEPYTLSKGLTLKNRFAMASLTRSRCDPVTGIPNDLMVQHYTERAQSAGLILTECAYVSFSGHAFQGAPGIVTKEQVEGWKKITKAVHDVGGLIFVQVYHCGRNRQSQLFKDRIEPLFAPSAIPIGFTPTRGGDPKTDYETPIEMTLDDIKNILNDFRVAAENAKEAGFDGIEVHGANGYLVDEFLRDYTNHRTDSYGGSIENRCRFVLEVVDQMINVFGADRVGIKLSPVGRYGDMFDSDPIAAYSYLLTKLNEKDIAYVQFYEGTKGGSFNHISGPEQIPNCAKAFRPLFKNTFITNGDLTFEEAKRRIDDNEADLACFGRFFISNPDLVERCKYGLTLAQADYRTFFTGGPKGYIDYPKADYSKVTLNE